MQLDLEDYFANPRRRLFQWKANARAGREGDGSAGAFNGTCLVYEGDTFYMELKPCEIAQADGTTRIGMPRLPTWADIIDEYTPPEEPKPIKRIPAGHATQAPAAPAVAERSLEPKPLVPPPVQRKGPGRGRWGPRAKAAPVESPADAPVHAE